MVHTLIVLILTTGGFAKEVYSLEFASAEQCQAAKIWVIAQAPKAAKAECFPSWM